MITFDVLRAVSPRATPARLQIFVGPIAAAIEEFGVRQVPEFLAQTAHESMGFTVLEEGLWYTAERLMQVWPRRFPDLTSALPYARNPEALANKVYFGRNGNTEPGDGYKYRGRGLVQTTGRGNYVKVEAATGLPVVEHPEMLLEPGPAARSAGAYWRDNGLDDIDDFVQQTIRVNGGTTGLADRQALLAAARVALGI